MGIPKVSGKFSAFHIRDRLPSSLLGSKLISTFVPVMVTDFHNSLKIQIKYKVCKVSSASRI